MDRKISGFSIIELLIIIAIISILASFPIKWYINYELDRKLTDASNSLVAELQWAKEHSIGGGVYLTAENEKRDVIYGVHINSTDSTYTVFRNLDTGCSFTQGEEVRTKKLPNGISFLNSTTVLFERRGYVLSSTCGFGAQTITLKNSNNAEKKVVISRYGRIRIE